MIMPSYIYKEGSLNLPALHKLLKKCFEVIVNECCNPVERRSVRLTRMGGKAIVSDCSLTLHLCIIRSVITLTCIKAKSAWCLPGNL